MKTFNEYIEKVQPKEYLESGLQNINQIAKDFDKAVIYFHEDLDGVTSAIGIRNYLKKYEINTINVIPIQYGPREYSVPKSKDNVLNVLVDFANGKYWMHVHTDHHDRQLGADKTQATAFVKAPSNVQQISTQLSSNDIFPQEDIKLISIVDSADYAKEGISVEEVIQSIFKLDKDKPLRINKQNQGFVVNKLLLSFKNKPDFLKRIVMESNPSLHSMYITIIKLIKEMNLEKDFTTKEGTEEYEKVQKDPNYRLGNLGGKANPNHVKRLGELDNFNLPKHKRTTAPGRVKEGQSILIGNLLVQYGSSPLWGKKKFDRYTAFKLNPSAHYFCMIWPMGLIQVSKNPFLKGENPVSLGELILGSGDGIKRSGGVMDKFKSELESKFVNLNTIKRIMEGDIKADTITKAMVNMGYKSESDAEGFTADDFANTFKGTRIHGLRKNQEWKDVMRAITNTKYHNLVEKEKEMIGSSSGTGGGSRMTIGQIKPKFRERIAKELTVADVYPEVKESDIGGDPNKILAIDMLKQVKIPLWDIIMVSSGGHKDITNISNLSFYQYTEENQGNQSNYKTFLRNIASEIANKMKDMELENIESIEESFNNLI